MQRETQTNNKSVPKQVQNNVDNALGMLKKIEEELNGLFEQECAGDVTTYFQLLIDFSVLADNLRSVDTCHTQFKKPQMKNSILLHASKRHFCSRKFVKFFQT